MKSIISLFVTLFICVILSLAQEKVFYSSFRPQGWDIYLSRDEGKSFIQFTDHESLDYDAKISPDGAWVVFTSERNGRPHLFLKGTQENESARLLVSSNSMQDQVDFSPDGKWIVFVSTHQGNADIYKLPFSPLDTLDVTEAINLTNDPGGDFRPKFSNDGNYIAYSSDRAHETVPMPRLVFTMQRTGDIYRMNAEGGRSKRLTSSEKWEGSPVWSPDDKEIIYYSADYLFDRDTRSFKLYKMSNSGENPQQISPDDYSCVSPCIKPDGGILFTGFVSGPNGFNMLGLNPETKEIDSTYTQPMNMLNVDYHKSGLMVYHGGETPQPDPTNLNDFTGDLLVKNSPQIIDDLPNKSLLLYGVRRSFSAPATPDGKIIYSVSDVNSFQQAITPYMYPLILIPILALFWFVYGIIQSIKKRKVISFWKHILFSILAVVSMGMLVKEVDNRLFLNVLPMKEVKQFLLIAFIIFLLLGVLSLMFFKKRKQANKPMAGLYKLYGYMFVPYGLIVFYAWFSLYSFFKTEKKFYAVEYTKKEITELFNFKPDEDFNPQFSNIIDAKITPDGSGLLFSVGGFRRSPKAVGCVYRYRFADKSIERMTDLDSNTGFADLSEDNKVMVFRSGRSGNMDIFVQENDSILNITNSPDKETFPVISYDGNKIAFCSDEHGIDKNDMVKTMNLYLVEREKDGWSDPKQLTTYEGQEGHAHFSPDGEWLIYTTEEYGINDEQPLVQPFIFSPQMYGEITAIRLADGEKFRLTHNKWEDGAPLWLKYI